MNLDIDLKQTTKQAERKKYSPRLISLVLFDRVIFQINTRIHKKKMVESRSQCVSLRIESMMMFFTIDRVCLTDIDDVL